MSDEFTPGELFEPPQNPHLLIIGKVGKNAAMSKTIAALAAQGHEFEVWDPKGGVEFPVPFPYVPEVDGPE